MSIHFSRRLSGLQFSPSLASIRRVREMRAAGIDVTDFGTKDDTPAGIKTAATRFIETPQAALYADSRGIPELRAAIARKLLRENDLIADPETEITVCAGGKQGILAALLALVDEGDEVLLEDPGWLSFEPMIRVTGATPVPVRLHARDGFRLTEAELVSRITSRTRVLLLCNPHNPTGRMLDAEDFDMIARVVNANNLVLIMDEAYEHFAFDGRRHFSIATRPDIRARTITVFTASKSYNMFGWRVGFVVAPPDITAQVRIITSHSITCVNASAQAGAVAALDDGIAPGGVTLAEQSDRYQTQRDAMMAGLHAIKGITCVVPAGAYFVFPDLSFCGLPMTTLATRLLEEAHLASVAGPVFGQQGERHLRFVFNAPVSEIEAGCERLARFLATI